MATTGSHTMTEFCEQVNPRVLLEIRRKRPVPDTLRLQESWTAAPEKRVLLWLAAHTPAPSIAVPTISIAREPTLVSWNNGTTSASTTSEMSRAL